MLNTSLLTGSYILSANSGPVDTCHVNGQTRVVVLHPHEVYFERLYDDIYVIRFGNENGTVQTTPDYRLVVQPGEQRWIIRQYDHESNVYTIVEAENPSLAWTDPGGPPGCNHWLYVTEIDPSNVPPAQRFTILRNDMQGNIHRRK